MKLRYFYKIDKEGHPIPGTLARYKVKPVSGNWKEVAADVCCPQESVCPQNIQWRFEIDNALGDFIITVNAIPVVNIVNSILISQVGEFTPEIGDVIDIIVNNDAGAIFFTGLAVTGGADFIDGSEATVVGTNFVWNGQLTHILGRIVGSGE